MSEPENKKRKSKNSPIDSSKTNSLSSKGLQERPKKSMVEDAGVVREQVFDFINNIELQKSLDMWMKRNVEESKIVSRDLSILKGLITEYLNSYILFGYDLKNERIIIQNCDNPKDRDALMEFLKIIFIKQQNENFLDQEGDF